MIIFKKNLKNREIFYTFQCVLVRVYHVLSHGDEEDKEDTAKILKLI